MPVPFGVSVGDFIAVAGLVREICEGLNDAHGSAAKYRAVMAVLGSLDSALERLQRLQCDDEALAAALQQATTGMKESIVQFVDRKKKYKYMLKPGEPISKWRDSLRKVQWAVVDGRDVTAFQTEITAHAMSVLIFLGAVQLIDNLRQKVDHASEELRHVKSFQVVLNETIRCYAGELLSVLAKLVRINVTMLYAIVGFHRLFTSRSPPQIDAGQYVTFQDASGSRYPIHLKTIDTWGAFEDVMKHKHLNEPGLSAVLSARYMLHDVTLQNGWQTVDMNRAFESVFVPGHSIDMTMIFGYDPETEARCPKCGRSEEEGYRGCKRKCPGCGLEYHKSFWLDTEVICFPDHYDVRPSVITGGTSSEHEQNTLNAECNSQGTTLATLAPKACGDVHRDSCPPSTSKHRLADYKSVYIAKPANVVIRAPSGSWLIFPWKLWKDVEGVRFALHHFIGPDNIEGGTRLFELGQDEPITEETFRTRLYPGISLETRRHTIDETQVPRPNLTTQDDRTARPCLLCGNTFYLQSRFDAHVQSHLRRRPCPTSCQVCLDTNRSAWDCPPNCACCPNHSKKTSQESPKASKHLRALNAVIASSSPASALRVGGGGGGGPERWVCCHCNAPNARYRSKCWMCLRHSRCAYCRRDYNC